MPDETNVEFPDDMPADQIKGMIQKKFPNIDFTKADPGFWAGAGRFARGMATEAGSIIEGMDPYLPTGPYIKPEEKIQTIHPPKDPAEKAGTLTTDIGALFAPVPGIGKSAGLERLASEGLRGLQARHFPTSTRFAKSIPALETIGGGLLEGGTRGAVGGAILPGEDKATDTGLGAAAGAGVRGAGAGIAAAVKALPPGLKNSLSVIAAVSTASKLGIPWWAVLPGIYDQRAGRYGSMLEKVYNTNLMDVASRYFHGLTRVPPQISGAAGVKLKQGFDEQ